MGKSYIRVRYASDDTISADRTVSRMVAKIPKTGMHGSNCNQKTCSMCHDWRWETIRPKKFYGSKKHVMDGNDFRVSVHKKRSKQPREMKECCICYTKVENYGRNQVQCGPRKRVMTICVGCKMNLRESGHEECPLCRSHPIHV